MAGTIYDVAKRAGVSPATVSRVYRDPDLVTKITRNRVLQAAEELNYRPSPLASALTTKTTLMIGLVVSGIENPFCATLARGVQDMVSAQGYVSIICSTGGDCEEESRALLELDSRLVDGLIITPSQAGSCPKADGLIRDLLARGMPIVLIGNRLDDPGVDFVTSYAQDGARRAVMYLASLGHQRIGFVGGRFSKGVAVGRWLGYQEGLIASRLPILLEYAVEAELSYNGGKETMHDLIELPRPPTAILAVNDMMAMGAISACRERGVRVPEDMSVIGFDNIPSGGWTSPPLTTVAQPTYELGRRAAELLLRRHDHPEIAPQQVVLACSLVVRETTGPCQQASDQPRTNTSEQELLDGPLV